MPLVKFNSQDEFCDEMAKDAGKIDRSIVRVTNLFRQSTLSPMIKHVLVVATYSVDGQVVHLERYCGDIWSLNNKQDKNTLDKAEKTQEAVKKACDDCGLELRAGILTPAGICGRRNSGDER
jgi:predicted ATPase